MFLEIVKGFFNRRGIRLKRIMSVELKPLSILDAPVEFTPLVAKLSFIKNKAAWALSLKGRAVIEIPKADYDLVLRN
jgi:predicted RNA-binding protein